MATHSQQDLTPPAAASDERPRLSLQIPEPPSSFGFPPSPPNPGGAQGREMPQDGVIEIESAKSDFSFGDLWEACYRRKKVKSGDSTSMAWNTRRDWTTGC